MPPRKKRDKLRVWFSSFFPSRKATRVESGGFFENAEGIAVKDSIMTSIRGDQHNTNNTVNNSVNNTTVNNQVNNATVNTQVFNMQGDHSTVTQIMSFLSQHIIQGAAHDSSARSPPPRCHPDTRVKLIARITAWFEGQGPQELLLWITGPAGVGKSAIVQTFAEYLAKSKSLGASVFISRPNKRNNPNGVFITIAYQLATRIEAYRKYVVERIGLDPELLRGDMDAQFATFIIEPFVERKIGAGGKRWGILLDGLDELRGEDAQRNIIHLISTFVHEHRDTPLVWIISSRPESHISNAFDDDDVRGSYTAEYIPIDSTEACEDVERFLRSTFKMIKKQYRQSVPTEWPSNTDFLVLTAAASGLFVYAQVVMEFIRDPDHGDPALRFEILISVISRSNVVPTKENPFVHLDVLYHEILSSIPPALWPTAKLLLGFTVQEIDELPLRAFRTLRGMSILFSLNRNTVYASLTKCRSALKIPDWKAAHKEKLTFLHASLADYLKDSSRSGEYYVGDIEDIERAVAPNLVEFWKKCSGDDVTPALIESTWLQYCSKVGGEKPSSAVAKFHATLFNDIVYSISKFPRRLYGLPYADIYELPLLEVHMARLCYNLFAKDLVNFVDFEYRYRRDKFLSSNDDITHYYDMLLSSNDTTLCRTVKISNLTFEHLDWKEMSPAKAYQGQTGKVFKETGWILNRPRSSAELKTFVSELEDIQRSIPGLEVAVFGGVPSGRVVIFRHMVNGTGMHFAIPYPE